MIVLNESKRYSIAVAVLAIFDMLWASFALAKLHFTHSWWYILVEVLVLGFFIFDYVARLVQAKGKWLFIRRSMFDFIAIISLHPSLTFFRIPRLLHIFRVPELLKRLKAWQRIEKVWQIVVNFVSTNGLIHVLYINFFAIIIGSVLVYLFERGVTFPTFGDAVWWACVTVTTVGYGDYVPKTVMGRIVAVLLMIVGIGLISMLTGTVATFFANLRKKNTLQKELDELNRTATTMDETELSQLVNYAKDLKNFSSDNNSGEGKSKTGGEESGVPLNPDGTPEKPPLDREIQNTTDGGAPLGSPSKDNNKEDIAIAEGEAMEKAEEDNNKPYIDAEEGYDSYLGEKQVEEKKESDENPPEAPV